MADPSGRRRPASTDGAARSRRDRADRHGARRRRLLGHPHRRAPRRDRPQAHPVLSQLGPDLCLRDADLDETVRRFDAFADPLTEIGVALLDQRVAAGIGNVYRSEVLWACRIDPFAPVRDIDATTRRRLLGTASELLRTNLERGGPRRTVTQGLAVYDRAGRPCPRCGAAIRSARLGEQARTAWWCPVCQTPR